MCGRPDTCAHRNLLYTEERAVSAMQPSSDILFALATLGPLEVFGERALLEDTARTASVRARGACDVVVMSRRDFRSVVAQFPALEDHFGKLLRERLPQMVEGRALVDCVAEEPALARPALNPGGSSGSDTFPLMSGQGKP